MLRKITLTVLVFAVGAPIALACNEPSLGSVTPRGAAGDPISFSITNLEPGAGVSISVAGRQVFSALAEDRSLNGSFPLPELDGVATVWVEARVQHDGGEWVSSRPVEIVSVASATAAPAAAPPEPTAPAPRSAPVPEAKSAAPAAKSTLPAPRATAPPVGSSEAESRPASTPSHAVAASAPAPRVRPASHRSVAPKVGATRQSPSQRGIAVPVAPRDRPAVDRATPSVAAVGSQAERWDDGLLEPALLILAAGALLLAGALAGLAVVRGRRVRHAAAIEAELQEILAEARAVQARASYEREFERELA